MRSKKTTKVTALKCKGAEKSINMTKVIKKCSFSVQTGEMATIYSPVGDGKTTLAKMICGLVPPSEGSITVRGRVAGYKTNALVSYQPETPYVNYENTVNDLLNIYKSFFRDFRAKRAVRLLKSFGIRAREKFINISDSDIRIIQIIMASSRKAVLFVFDNPLNGTDKKYHKAILETISDCKKYGGVVLLTSKAYTYLEDYTEKVGFIRRGELSLYEDIERIPKIYGKNITQLYKEVYRNV
ncbi:MAG: ATP-binding cassette domain-containing protein [Firmicutes bacterium]|nr:ATP-binding cassette domain-containing protein [Bacillota bacterium]